MKKSTGKLQSMKPDMQPLFIMATNKKDCHRFFFQILITPLASDYQTTRFSSQPDAKYIAKVEGGSLIQMLPSSIEDATSDFSSVQKLAYQRGFEADMINSLVGPLAEAKYIALRDGEPINPRLVHLNALHNYGGTTDLERVNEYLECFFANEELREQKITELFLTAFNFIDDSSNWPCH
jgi:hypothetical protein